eukprot:1663742-Amphidinium_carterae.1
MNQVIEDRAQRSSTELLKDFQLVASVELFCIAQILVQAETLCVSFDYQCFSGYASLTEELRLISGKHPTIRKSKQNVATWQLRKGDSECKSSRKRYLLRTHARSSRIGRCWNQGSFCRVGQPNDCVFSQLTVFLELKCLENVCAFV